MPRKSPTPTPAPPAPAYRTLGCGGIGPQARNAHGGRVYLAGEPRRGTRAPYTPLDFLRVTQRRTHPKSTWLRGLHGKGPPAINKGAGCGSNVTYIPIWGNRRDTRQRACSSAMCREERRTCPSMPVEPAGPAPVYHAVATQTWGTQLPRIPAQRAPVSHALTAEGTQPQGTRAPHPAPRPAPR